MTRQQMLLLDQLFELASAVSESERKKWLAENCSDPEVRAELESLLPYAAATGGFTAALQTAATLGGETVLTSGYMLGPYRIAGILGEGGMGVVYEGIRDDHQFRQRVAVKVLRIGARSEALRRRFLQERQILAALEHPNIARLFDGGNMPDGSPYLVMERIDGEPLTTYANSRKLSIRERLELFRQVANAVQFAHQKLIVHRDLKPGNILVGADGVPKLLDFGIAKLIDDDTASLQPITATGLHMMTPDYASPEQVQGKPVTAASDVYSLGAVLYELLSGTRPHGLKGYHPSEIAERICTAEIAPPSATGGARLRGDLDTIVLKAMHKVPERRYNSAEQFSEDIHRYLEGRPVMARPDATAYRMRKFIGRHWVGLSATAAVITALSVGIAVSIYQARIAQERFELVRTLANRFLFDFHAEIEHLSGTTKAQEMVVNTAVEYLDKLSRTAGSDRALLLEMAEAYSRLAKVQGAAGVSGDGRHGDALLSQRRSVELYRRLAAIDRTKRQNLAHALLDQAHLEENMLQNASQLEHSREAVRILDAVLVDTPRDLKLTAESGIAHVGLASALRASDQLNEALAEDMKGQEYFRATLGTGDDLLAKYRLAIAEQYEAEVRLALGDVDRAIATLETALRMIEEITTAAPDNRYYRYLFGQHLTALADAYYSIEEISNGDPVKATAVRLRCIEATKKYMEADPEDRAGRMTMAIAESEGAIPMMEVDPIRALEYARSGLARFDQILESVPGDQFSIPRRAKAEMRFALALVKVGRSNDAITPSREAVATFRDLMGKPDGANYRKHAVFALAISGQALGGANRDREAEKAYEEAAAIGQQLRDERNTSISNTIAATFAFDHFGDYWKSRGDTRKARQWFERSRAAWAARAEQTRAVQQRRKQAQEKLDGLEP